MRMLNIGGWKINASDEVVQISYEVKKDLENFLTEVNTKAKLVRLDMFPRGGIYEVELAPGGLMFWGALRGGLLLDEVVSLAKVALCLYEEWVEAYKYLCSVTGWKLITRWEEVTSLVYYSGEPERLPPGVTPEVFITDPWGGKIIPRGRPLTLKDDLRQLEKKYPMGFVLKPLDGWWAYHVYFHPPEGYPKKVRGHTGAAVARVIEQAWEELKCGRPRWFVQPFIPPEEV